MSLTPISACVVGLSPSPPRPCRGGRAPPADDVVGLVRAWAIPLPKTPPSSSSRGGICCTTPCHLCAGPARQTAGWAIGIAESTDLRNWKKIGEVLPEQAYEQGGICAPGARVLNGKVHLFYQSYGHGQKNAICHAWSSDGVTFDRDPSNPVFHPTGAWTNGRAIDAEVVAWKGKLWLYCATRDPSGKIQMLSGAVADPASDLGRDTWKQIGEGPLLKPEQPWEQACIEVPTVCLRGDKLVMFYAGAYNNAPQQIGAADQQ